MLRLRLTIDCQPRTNSGAPAQTTTGVASAISSHGIIDAGIARSTRCPEIMCDISRAGSELASATLIQTRRVMSASTGAASSSAVLTRGSSAIPQIGQLPGPGRTISGCIGQVYSLDCDFGDCVSDGVEADAGILCGAGALAASRY